VACLTDMLAEAILLPTSVVIFFGACCLMPVGVSLFSIFSNRGHYISREEFDQKQSVIDQRFEGTIKKIERITDELKAQNSDQEKRLLSHLNRSHETLMKLTNDVGELRGMVKGGDA